MLIRKTLERKGQVEGKESKYIYRLVEEDYKNERAYGIEVEREDYNNENVVNIERDSILKISNQVHKVEGLLEKLYNNEVSPIHLVDVIGAYVDEYVLDFEG